MNRHDFYNILKSHAEKENMRYTFKVIDLKVACAEIEDALSHLHKLNVMQAEASASAEGEQLGNEAGATVAARGQCEHECTGPWDCQCQDVIDAFYRDVERKSSGGQL